MNKVILQGRLTRDVELRYSQGENATAVARNSLAVDRRFKRQGEEQTADFINIVAFGKTAETLEKYTHKGSKITICGRIQTGSYTNKEGQKVYTTDVIVEEFDFCEKKGETGAVPKQPSQPTGRPDPSSVDENGFMNIPDALESELPFA